MAVVEEILRSEADGSISFGNHKLAKKAKVEDYEHAGDLLKVKTYNEMTKLEKNGMFLYESVPGTSVLEFKESDNSVEFIVEGDEDSQITVGLKDDTEYEVLIDGKNVGTMKTGLGGKLSLSVELEAAGEVDRFIFGFEESYGCLIGTHARDKDAIVATMALCEAAAYYKTKDMTLWDAMIEMYERYGYYKDGVQSITMKGIEGLAKIQEIMTELRENPPKEIDGHKVLSFRDYKADTVKDIETGEVKPTGLPKSNVLYFDMSDNVWMCVRPSGTEPKIKFYYGVVGESLEDADKKSEAMAQAVTDMVAKMS